MEDDEEAAKREKRSQTSQRLTIPRRVWTKSRPIVEELHEIVRAKMREARYEKVEIQKSISIWNVVFHLRAGMEGRQFVQRDLGDYTSLYWDPGTTGDESNCRSENEYEIVGEGMEEEGGGGRKSRGGFRYSSISSCLGGGVRAMRESLLRELRRDLARYNTRSGQLFGEFHFYFKHFFFFSHIFIRFFCSFQVTDRRRQGWRPSRRRCRRRIFQKRPGAPGLGAGGHHAAGGGGSSLHFFRNRRRGRGTAKANTAVTIVVYMNKLLCAVLNCATLMHI